MAVIRNLVVKVSADISSLSKGLQSAQKSIQKVSAAFTKAGKTLTASITAPLVALATASVKVSTEFEQSMANAASVAGATGDDFERMKNIAREMGSKTVFSASQAADALYYMASAGYKVDQMADSIEATLNLASATQTDLASATDIVIATLNQFGLEANQAERVTNTFAAAIGASMASMDKLSNSMGYVGPVANSLGYSIEETVGALSVLYNAGYDGSTAGTALRQSMVSLMNPSSAAIAIFEELGLAYEELNPATNDLATIVDKLGQAGLDTSQAMKIFGARAGPGMLALLSAGGDAIRDMTDAVTGTNKANEMAEVQLDTLQGQYKILKSELEEIAIAFGDVLIPIIRQFITKYISPLTAKLMGLTMGQRKQIVLIAAIAAAIGPLLLVIGKLGSGLSTLVKGAAAVISKLGVWGIVIAAVIVILVVLWKKCEAFRTAVTKIFEKVKTAVLKAVDKIKAWWAENGERIKTAVVAALKKIWQVVKTVFTKVWKFVTKVWTAVKKIIVDVVGVIKQIWQKDGAKIVEEVKRIFTAIWNVIVSIVNAIIPAIQRFFSYLAPIWERIKALIMSLWDTFVELYETLKPVIDVIAGIIAFLLSVVTGVIDGILSALGPFIDSVIDVANAVIEVIRMVCAILRGDWSDAWEHMKNVASNIWESIKKVFLGIWEFIKGFGEGFVNYWNGIGVDIVGIFKTIWEKVSGFFVNLWEGIKSVCANIWNGITGLFNSIGDFFKNLFSQAFNWGKNLINNIWEGIQAAWNWVVDGIKSIGQAIADFLGFGSPTKKGPCHTADEWIPNLMDMMAEGMYEDIPDIEKAATAVAQTIGVTACPNRAMVGQGNSPNGELVNALLQGIVAAGSVSGGGDQEIVMEIDGQAFARLIVPRLNKEYKRNGILLTEV